MLDTWATEALEASELPEEARGYLYGRGATDQAINGLNLKIWTCPTEASPSEDFNERYGPYGQFFEGKLMMPLYSPRGRLIGWDARSVGKKDVTRSLLPGAGWVPVWIGTPLAMGAIWKGQKVWIVEGIFDLFALRQVIAEPILGTGPSRLVKNHVRFLRRFASEVNMVLDRDPTGQRATAAGLKQLRFLGVECRDIPYRQAKDPGEIWDQYGVTGLRDAFSRY